MKLLLSFFVFIVANWPGLQPLLAGNIFTSEVILENRECRTSRVWAGFGHLNAQANEIVYGGPGGPDGEYLSRLVWDTDNTVTANVGFEAEFNPRWSLYGEVAFSLGPDDSHMENYDWLMPTSEWSDQSIHPDTDLDHYFQFDLGFDYHMLKREKLNVDLRFGFRYTDISFTAYGGDFTYSFNDFRDTVGSFPDGAPIISYRQKHPGFSIGPRFRWCATPRLTVRGGAFAGITLNASGRDHHWERELLFEDHLKSSAYYGASVGIDYRIGCRASFYLEGMYDEYTRADGSTTVTYQGASVDFGEGSAAADLRTSQVRVGVKIEGKHRPLFPDKNNPWNF